ILAGMFVVDNFAIFFKFALLLTIALTILASIGFLESAPYPAVEYFSLLLFSGVGMLFMVSGSNLISIYVALELMALASYILAGYFKGQVKSTEAALKYFILGAFSSAVLLYGLSLVYGVGGKLGLTELAEMYAGTERTNLIVLGILLVLAGLLFKIAAVPFHVWTPDVYEGSPTPVTAFFAVGPKLAAYAVLARIFYVGFPRVHADWGLIAALAAAARLGCGDHDLGQRRGAPANQCQADVRVLLDCPRRVCAARRPRVPDDLRPLGDPGLSPGVHVHELRRLRAGDLPRDARLRGRDGGRLQ